MKANDRYHAIYRILFPFRYRYVESRSCGLETPYYRDVSHDESKGRARSCQKWETDQGYHQESGVKYCRGGTLRPCKLPEKYSMQVGDLCILCADQH